jgi:hypothetical protein
MFHVKHRVPVPNLPSFHVKQNAYRMNKEILLSYTKLTEDHVKDIFNIHPPQQPPQ